MTLALSLKINDGVIIAADSASTYTMVGAHGTPIVAKVYYNANKVFNLRKKLPIGATTWGLGSIGEMSMSSIVKDFRLEVSDQISEESTEYTVKDFAEQLKKYIFEDRWLPAFKDQADPAQMGFMVAGYSYGQPLPELYQIYTDKNQIIGPEPIYEGEIGLAWRGQVEAITRLLYGFSPLLPLILEHELGVPTEQVKQLITVLSQRLTTSFMLPTMPLQDAIDAVEFLVEMTIQHSKFMGGAQVVGGPIDIAVITKHEGFKWIKRKHYFGRELNPLD